LKLTYPDEQFVVQYVPLEPDYFKYPESQVEQRLEPRLQFKHPIAQAVHFKIPFSIVCIVVKGQVCTQVPL